MGLGTKNRQRQVADACRDRLREKYQERAALVVEFIREFEGEELECTRWTVFADESRDILRMFERLEARFEGWLRGDFPAR